MVDARTIAIGVAAAAGVLLIRKRLFGFSPPLRAAALQVSLVEDTRWGDTAPSTARVDEYLAGVEPHGRDLVRANTDSDRINFCAAAVGWTERVTKLPNLPPWRSGAKQIMHDAVNGLRPGAAWHPRGDLALGWTPPAGALAIYHRGDPESFSGHVDRVVLTTPNGYMAVGANERGRQWTVEFSPYASQRLLGFVVDGDDRSIVKAGFVEPVLMPAPPTGFVEPLMTDEEHAEIRGQG